MTNSHFFNRLNKYSFSFALERKALFMAEDFDENDDNEEDRINYINQQNAQNNEANRTNRVNQINRQRQANSEFDVNQMGKVEKFKFKFRDIGEVGMTANEYVENQLDNVLDAMSLASSWQEDPVFTANLIQQLQTKIDEVDSEEEKKEAFMSEFGEILPASTIESLRLKDQPLNSDQLKDKCVENVNDNQKLLYEEIKKYTGDKINRLKKKIEGLQATHPEILKNTKFREEIRSQLYAQNPDNTRAGHRNGNLTGIQKDIFSAIVNLNNSALMATAVPELTQNAYYYASDDAIFNEELQKLTADYLENNEGATTVPPIAMRDLRARAYKETFKKVAENKRVDVKAEVQDFTDHATRIENQIDAVVSFVENKNDPLKAMTELFFGKDKDNDINREVVKKMWTNWEEETKNMVNESTVDNLVERAMKLALEVQRLKDNYTLEERAELIKELSKPEHQMVSDGSDKKETVTPFEKMDKSIKHTDELLDSFLGTTYIDDEEEEKKKLGILSDLPNDEKESLQPQLENIKAEQEQLKNKWEELNKNTLDDPNFQKAENKKAYDDIFKKIKANEDAIDKKFNSIKRTMDKKIKNNATAEAWRFVSIGALKDSLSNLWKFLVEDRQARKRKMNVPFLEERLSKLGKTVTFGELEDDFEIFGRRAAVNQENVNQEERDKWKYDNHDNKQLLDELKDLKDNDKQHLRKLMEVLADRGILRWDDPNLWEKMETVTGMKMPKSALNDLNLRRSVLQQMGAEIGDKDWFKGVSNKNSNNFDAKAKELDSEAKEINSTLGAKKKLASILEEHLVAAHKENHLNKCGQMKEGCRPHQFDNLEVDPHLYTSIFLYITSITDARAEDKIFFLVRGIATGLIPYSFLNSLADKNFFNNWPDLNFFRAPSYEKVLEMDRYFTGVDTLKKDRNINNVEDLYHDDNKDLQALFRPGQRVTKFINNQLATHAGVLERTTRIIDDWHKNVDKDINQAALNKVTRSNIENIVYAKAGSQGLSTSGACNGIVGFSTRFDMFDRKSLKKFSSSFGFKDDKALKDLQAANRSFLYFESGIRGRFVKPSRTKFDDNTCQLFGGEDKSGLKIIDHINIMHNFIKTFLVETGYDIRKFDILFNNKYSYDDDPKKQEANKKKQESSILNFIDNELPRYFKNHSDKYECLLAKWQAKGAFANYHNKNKVEEVKSIADDYTKIDDDLKLKPGDLEEWKKDPDYFIKKYEMNVAEKDAEILQN